MFFPMPEPLAYVWPNHKSCIVQDLSAFAGSLKWMAPVGHPAQELCERAEWSLSRGSGRAAQLPLPQDNRSVGTGVEIRPDIPIKDFDGTLDLSGLDWIDDQLIGRA